MTAGIGERRPALSRPRRPDPVQVVASHPFARPGSHEPGRNSATYRAFRASRPGSRQPGRPPYATTPHPGSQVTRPASLGRLHQRASDTTLRSALTPPYQPHLLHRTRRLQHPPIRLEPGRRRPGAGCRLWRWGRNAGLGRSRSMRPEADYQVRAAGPEDVGVQPGQRPLKCSLFGGWSRSANSFIPTTASPASTSHRARAAPPPTSDARVGRRTATSVTVETPRRNHPKLVPTSTARRRRAQPATVAAEPENPAPASPT